MFRLTLAEWNSLRSQIVTLEKGRGKHPKYLPHALTEHGVSMLASVLNSEQAILVNIAIIRAFIVLRQFTLEFKDLALKLKEIEKKYNQQFKDVYHALNFLMEKRKKEDDFSKRERIGFRK